MQDRTRFLHEEVEIVPSGQHEFLLVNRRTGSCFLLGAAERYLLELLEQGKSAEEISAAFQSDLGTRLSNRNVREFVEQLRRLRMLEGSGDASVRGGARDMPETTADLRELAVADRTQILNFRFDLINLLFGWILHPIWIVPTLVLALMAANVLVRHWDRIIDDLARFHGIYPFWLKFLLVIVPRLLLLNFIRSLLVGMICRQSGARVHGFALRLWEGVIPYFRLDVGDSFVLMTERGRRTFLFLGFWFPVAFGSACVVGWAIAAPDSGAGTFCLLFLVPCLMRLGLQINVYYQYSTLYVWLCDMTEHWNLLQRARDETRAWLSHRLSPRPLSVRERFWLRCFGLGYYAYRLAQVAVMLFVFFHWILPDTQLVGTIVFVFVLWWWNHDLLAPCCENG